MSLAWVYLGFTWPPTPKDIPEPSHGRVFREKFHSVLSGEGVWSLLTDLLFNRLTRFLQQAIYSAIGLVIYVFWYCMIIRQINTFREDYLYLDNTKDSIDDVSINDLVKRDKDKY